MPKSGYSRRFFTDILGRTLAENGPMTRDQIIAVVAASIPPEMAYERADLKNKDRLPHEEVVRKGSRSIITGLIPGWMNRLLVDREGLLFASAEFRGDFPELFVEELRVKPDLYSLAVAVAAKLRPGQPDSGFDTGIRVCLREMLRMCGKNVGDGFNAKRQTAT